MVIVALLLAVWMPVAAQQALGSPYRDQRISEIRGLSAVEIEDLRAGRGMGLARAAELNGFPGPRHVLDASEAGKLHLSPEQLPAIRGLFEGMSREARRLGEAILQEEHALEAAFRGGVVSEADIRGRVERIAALSGELRMVHVRTHLRTRALLTPAQLERYDQIRGYTESPAGRAPHAH